MSSEDKDNMPMEKIDNMEEESEKFDKFVAKTTRVLLKLSQSDRFYKLYHQALDSAEEIEEFEDILGEIEDDGEGSSLFESLYEMKDGVPPKQQREIGFLHPEETEIDSHASAIHNIAIFYVFSTVLCEEVMSEIFILEIVSDEYKSEGLLEEINSNYGFYDYLNILHSAGLIDDGLKGELTQVKRLRNKIVHAQVMQISGANLDEPVTEVERVYRAVEQLFEIHREVFGYE